MEHGPVRKQVYVFAAITVGIAMILGWIMVYHADAILGSWGAIMESTGSLLNRADCFLHRNMSLESRVFGAFRRAWVYYVLVGGAFALCLVAALFWRRTFRAVRWLPKWARIFLCIVLTLAVLTQTPMTHHAAGPGYLAPIVAGPVPLAGLSTGFVGTMMLVPLFRYLFRRRSVRPESRRTDTTAQPADGAGG